MWTDNASKIDMLFYKPYAEIVSDIAIETDIDPLTIGILGLWGAGKSTLLNLIEQHYKKFSPSLLLEEYELIAKSLDEPELIRVVFDNFKNLLLTK